MSLPVRDRALGRTAFAPLGAVNTHFWLVQRMARATGTDLLGAPIAPSDWAAMVQRCRGCDWSQACARWLDLPTNERRPVPQGCANKTSFADLRAKRDSETPV